MTLNFYRERELHGEFSNFFKAPIELDGKIWKTTEHYYQAQKSLDEDVIENIRLASDPKKAAGLGRSLTLRPHWEAVKEEVMKKALLAKFTQHLDLQKKLLETKGIKLVEKSPFDGYWGSGSDGLGKNRLGELLMELRALLEKAQPKE